jgi:nitrogen fixation/metabolism regulation signal transduction histidine kinase
MKTVKTRPQYSILNVRGLIFIYVLLCILTVYFSRTFFSETLQGNIPSRLSMVVFFTTPAVLLVILGIVVVNLLGDIIVRRPGTKFRARLLAYFVVTVIFAAAPMVIITGITINEAIRFWRGINVEGARVATHSFAVDNYSFHIEHFEDILRKTNWDSAPTDRNWPPTDISSVQDFLMGEDGWEETGFSGTESDRLTEPPSTAEGYVMRELPRDIGLIRYVMAPSRDRIRLVNYNLGAEFDIGLAAIENQGERFETLGIMWDNARILALFYYGVFFFPTLLMTMIIAVSFTRRVTNPIVELTDATRRVAEGDFSIQILARRGDEMGLLIRSFNAMVQDLEKSRAALVKAEKISIWQNMAQQLAHEIKNPLTPIKLSAERVLRRWRNDPQRIGEIVEDSMLAIIQETEGLSTLLNEFRTLARPIEPSQSWTRVEEAVEETIGPYRSSFPRVQFNTEHISGGITVKIDKHRLSQALANLFINAIDAMDGKGYIEIRTDIVKKREIQYCRFSIKDSGKGIPKQIIPQIFTPYYTTKESGTGLGLSIVERIVNDHGGTIWFNSSEGMGTTFFIDLPVSGEEG